MRHAADLRSVAVILATIGLRFGCFLTPESKFLFWAVLLNLFLTLVCMSVYHNHLHLSVFYNKSLNAALSRLCSLLTGSLEYSLVAVHLASHHCFENAREDITSLHHVTSGSNPALNLWLYPFKILPQLISSKKALLKDKRQWRTKIKREKIGLWIVLAGITTWNAKLSLLFFLLPMAFNQYYLLLSNYLQHHTSSDEGLKHSNNITGRLYNLLFFNLGYHIVHHLHPDMHWRFFPETYAKLKDQIAPENEFGGFGTLLVHCMRR